MGSAAQSNLLFHKRTRSRPEHSNAYHSQEVKKDVVKEANESAAELRVPPPDLKRRSQIVNKRTLRLNRVGSISDLSEVAGGPPP
jgi:hypothetical protein